MLNTSNLLQHLDDVSEDDTEAVDIIRIASLIEFIVLLLQETKLN